MSSKGQYMAIEAVLSLGLSLIVALAALTAFGSFRDSMVDVIEERNLEIASSEVMTSIYNLGVMDDGSTITVNLPKNGEVEYGVTFDNDSVEISSGSLNEEYSLKGLAWANDFRGTAEGTSFRIVRVNDVVVVESN